MTVEARHELKPRKLYEILTAEQEAKITAARKRHASESVAQRKQRLRKEWEQLLGDIRPRPAGEVLCQTEATIVDNSIVVERIALQAESAIVVPLILLHAKKRRTKTQRIVVAVAQAGKEAFLRERSEEIAELLEAGATVCLPDVRGVGASRGSRGELDSASYYALFFETPLLGYRLRDLRAVLDYLRSREDLATGEFALWGDSFTAPNADETNFQVPKRVSGRPRFSEPLGGLLAMLGALYEDDVQAVYTQGGLCGYHDVLGGPYVYIPHDVVVPGLLTKGDLSDLAAALAPRPLRLEGVVDGYNRRLPVEKVIAAYQPATAAYRQSESDELSFAANRMNAAEWLLKPAVESEKAADSKNAVNDVVSSVR